MVNKKRRGAREKTATCRRFIASFLLRGDSKQRQFRCRSIAALSANTHCEGCIQRGSWEGSFPEILIRHDFQINQEEEGGHDVQHNDSFARQLPCEQEELSCRPTPTTTDKDALFAPLYFIALHLQRWINHSCRGGRAAAEWSILDEEALDEARAPSVKQSSRRRAQRLIYLEDAFENKQLRGRSRSRRRVLRRRRRAA